MSEDESKNNSSEGEPDVPIIPALNTEYKGSNQIKERGRADSNTHTEEYAAKVSRFQSFMHKHFPDAKPHDRWQLVFTFVIALSTFCYTIFAGWTLVEIHSGSIDTHTLAVAAVNQAAFTEEIAQAASDQVDAANEISDAADSFSDTTETAVGEFRKAAKESASISRRAAKSTEDAVHISERAYVNVSTAALIDYDKRTITLVVSNGGRIPSGPADAIVHAFLVKVSDQHAKTADLNTAAEKSWKRTHYNIIPVGSPFTIGHFIAGLDQAEMEAGHQMIFMVGVVSYNDGFTNTPTQQSMFCINAAYTVIMKQLTMSPCDPAIVLPAAELADGYPANEAN
jgi:hypothetical protein